MFSKYSDCWAFGVRSGRHRSLQTRFSAGRRRHAASDQRGFSSLEILISTILIGLLVAGGIYYANIGDKVHAVNMASVQTNAVVRFPEAIMTIYTQTNDLRGTRKVDLLRTRSVVDNRPVNWLVPGSGSDGPIKDEISVKFIFTQAEQARSFLSYLNSHINTTMVKSAVSADQGLAAMVRYSVDSV